MPVPTLIVLLIAVALTGACAEPGDRDTAEGQTPAAAVDTPETSESRPTTRTDTLHLEGMPEPIRLSLFRTPAEFPLRFSAYVPEDMATEVEEETEDGGAAARFVAEFGGQRSPDAFLHLFVFPEGTPGNEAIAQARGYEASRGVPVSQGIEPLNDESGSEAADAGMPWAVEAFRFRYQSGGQWFVGAIGVGEVDGRYFQLVRHYPAEYGDGFGPRAALITETWRWADGTPLHPDAG